MSSKKTNKKSNTKNPDLLECIYETKRSLFRWVRQRKKWQRLLIYIFTVLFLVFCLHRLIEASWSEVKNPNYGVSFSKLYANELHVDWRANFIALLDDMKIKNYRLMSYWNVSEPEKGKYNYDDLKWQMDEAAKRGAKVSLSVGMRQPRWPECHKPHWYTNLNKKDRDQAIIDFVSNTVKTFKDHPALASYQLENEAVNSWFGECTPEDIDQARLEKEFEAIKKIDTKHPVYMSLSDQHGLPLGKPVPDKYGYSVYRVVWNDKTGPFEFYLTYPTPVWYHRLRGWWIKTFKHRDIFVHELQIEPWGPAATVDLTVEEQDRSMDPEQIRENVRFARKIGYRDIYTWGGEWWYWRKTVHNDPSIWNAVKQELNRP